MTKREKFLWGGLGGIIPLTLRFLGVGPDIIATTTLGLFAFYAIRVLILFALGGVTTFFEKTEEPWVLMRMGVAAPLLFAGIVSQNTAAKQAYMDVSEYLLHTKFEVVQTLYADAGTTEGEDCGGGCTSNDIADFYKGRVWDWEEKTPTLGQIANQALTGAVPPTHFIIAGERPNEIECRKFAISLLEAFSEKKLLSNYSMVTVRVFRPYKKLNWTVVVSRKLTHEQADTLMKIFTDSDFKGMRVYDLINGEYDR